MRRILLVILGFGIFTGYGSAIASARWHARNGGGCEGRWERSERWGDRRDRELAAPAAAVAAPQTIVVPQAAAPAAAPAAPAPQIFVITVPSGVAAPAPAPQIITVPVPVPAAAAPAANQ